MSTAAIVLGGLAATSTVISGYSAYRQGKAEREAYNATADIYAANARNKRMETAAAEDLKRKEVRRKMSSMRAGLSENNMLESTTSLGVLGQSAGAGEADALNLHYKGENEAINFINQENLNRYYGDMAYENGKTAFNMSFLQAGVAGLSSYALAGGEFADFGSLFETSNTVTAPGGTTFALGGLSGFK